VLKKIKGGDDVCAYTVYFVEESEGMDEWAETCGVCEGQSRWDTYLSGMCNADSVRDCREYTLFGMRATHQRTVLMQDGKSQEKLKPFPGLLFFILKKFL